MADARKSSRGRVRLDYSILADVKVPRRTRPTRENESKQSQSSKLYRLKILEEDKDNPDLVKVGYVGYGSEYDEWRSKKDIVSLAGNDDGSEDDPREDSEHSDSDLEGPPTMKQFSLYEELAMRIKSMLVSYRKGDPVCCISMSFDTIFFDGLIRRGMVVTSTSRQTKYTLSSLTKLDDILGRRWYIRGLNTAGDFCYVKPGTVNYYLKYSKGRTEYQLKSDGTLASGMFGHGYRLLFKFIREDGTASQWNDVLKLCQ